MHSSATEAQEFGDDLTPDPVGLDAASPDPRSVCPDPVVRPVMMHRWDRLTFLHWRYDPAVVQRLLPPGLIVQTFDGSAWVALVPFVMQVRVPRCPPVPWLSNFPETNVRTYVTGPDGRSGVWFFSLDAARLPAVAVARTAYRLPYFWSEMSVEGDSGHMSYRTRRRWPDPRPATSHVEVRVGSRFAPRELGELDHWLTARWALWSRFPRSVARAQADHPPWELHHAEVRHLDDTLVVAAGLPAPSGEPLVHYSPGVEVRIGTIRTIRT